MVVEVYTPALQVVADDDDMILNLDSIQRLWTVEQYLRMTDHSRRLIEYTNTNLRVGSGEWCVVNTPLTTTHSPLENYGAI